MFLDWKLLHPDMTLEHLGFIPLIIVAADHRSAKEQIADRYAHGGGWSPYRGFQMVAGGTLVHPGDYEDEELRPLAEATLRDETIRFYDHSWVSIEQPDGSYEVSRMD
jgi:hypothetical protein